MLWDHTYLKSNEVSLRQDKHFASLNHCQSMKFCTVPSNLNDSLAGEIILNKELISNFLSF